jgi:hypothetical protein
MWLWEEAVDWATKNKWFGRDQAGPRPVRYRPPRHPTHLETLVFKSKGTL